MELMSIASGSSGNCIYVGDENTHILVDAGISRKRIEEGLNTIGLTTGDLTAILVTHEHIDHIGGLGVLTRKCCAPVFSTEGTREGILGTGSLEKSTENSFRRFIPMNPLQWAVLPLIQCTFPMMQLIRSAIAFLTEIRK